MSILSLFFVLILFISVLFLFTFSLLRREFDFRAHFINHQCLQLSLHHLNILLTRANRLSIFFITWPFNRICIITCHGIFQILMANLYIFMKKINIYILNRILHQQWLCIMLIVKNWFYLKKKLSCNANKKLQENN